MRNKITTQAIAEAGGAKQLSKKLKISQPAVSMWDKVPIMRVLAVEKITGISRYRLRPDLFWEASVKRSKYNAVKTEVDGITFASKAEARRYSELKLLERGRWIEALELQPRFDCIVNGIKVCTYVADFRYAEPSLSSRYGRTVIEDVKGVKTPVYRLKKRLAEALHGITITEITK